MRIFVINLDKNHERLAKIDAQLKTMALPYDRIRAVYGASLSREERRRVYRPFRAWCAIGATLLDGEIGCALSHLKIYRKMIEEEIPYACILEDDAILYPRFNEGLEFLEKTIMSFKLPENAVVNFLPKTGRSEGLFSIEKRQNGTCTFGYVITAQAARNILNANFPVITQADVWGRWQGKGLVSYYVLIPQIVTQDLLSFSSEIEECHCAGAKGFIRIFRKPLRAMGWLIDRIIG